MTVTGRPRQAERRRDRGAGELRPALRRVRLRLLECAVEAGHAHVLDAEERGGLAQDDVRHDEQHQHAAHLHHRRERRDAT